MLQRMGSCVNETRSLGFARGGGERGTPFFNLKNATIFTPSQSNCEKGQSRRFKTKANDRKGCRMNAGL